MAPSPKNPAKFGLDLSLDPDVLQRKIAPRMFMWQSTLTVRRSGASSERAKRTTFFYIEAESIFS